MITATRIVKANPHNDAASRVCFADLSEVVESRFEPSAFAPLTLPTGLSSRCEPHTDSRLISTLAALQTAANQLQAQRDHWLDQSQHDAVRLGIAIAERLLRRTLAVQPEAVLDLIRSALDWSVGVDRLRVRLNPADAELLASESTTQPFEVNRQIEFLPDNSLTRGDCVVESANSQTDARLDVILQRIADELLAD